VQPISLWALPTLPRNAGNRREPLLKDVQYSEKRCPRKQLQNKIDSRVSEERKFHLHWRRCSRARAGKWHNYFIYPLTICASTVISFQRGKYFDLRSDSQIKLIGHILRAFCTLCQSFKLIVLIFREEKRVQMLALVATSCLCRQPRRDKPAIICSVPRHYQVSSEGVTYHPLKICAWRVGLIKMWRVVVIKTNYQRRQTKRPSSIALRVFLAHTTPICGRNILLHLHKMKHAWFKASC